MSEHAKGIGGVARMAQVIGDSGLDAETWHDVARILASASSVMELDGIDVDELCRRMGARGEHAARRDGEDERS